MFDAKEKAGKALEAARNEARKIIAEAEKDAADRAESARQSAEAEADSLKKRMLSVANLEDRKRMLKVRQDMVDAAFESALEKVVNLPDDEYGNLLQGFILNSVREGEGEISLNRADKYRLGEKFVKKVNDKLKSIGKASSLKLSSGEIGSKGGYILKYGNMEINGTIEIIIGMLRPKLESEVAAILFE